MPLHEEIDFYKWTFGRPDDDSGPRIGIVTGVHGDELTGPFLAWQLIRHFRQNESLIKRGSVMIIPAVNPMGINVSSHHWPFDQTDLNSLFPGYREGETTQRIAAAVFEEIIGCDFCVNIQSGTNMLDELPQIRLYEPSHGFSGVAEEFRLPVLWRRKTSHPLDKTLFVSQLGKAGVPAFSLHAGAALRLQPATVARVFDGILDFLAGVKTIEQREASSLNETLVVDDDNVSEIVAPDAGLYLAEKEVGSLICRGDLLGRIVDPCVGEKEIDILSPVDGLLMTSKVYPLTYEGDLLARIVKKE